MEDDARGRARKIAEARYGFRWHLLVYVFVNIGLVGIWYFSGQGFSARKATLAGQDTRWTSGSL